MTTSNGRSKSGRDVRQLDLFSLLHPNPNPPQPGDLNIDIRLRAAISEAIRRSGKDRYDICAEMAKLTGVEVSKHGLDSWSAESRAKSSDLLDTNGNKRWGIPAELLAAFCQAVDDWRPIHIIVEACRLKAVRGKDIVRARLGEVQEEVNRLNKERKQLERALTECKEGE